MSLEVKCPKHVLAIAACIFDSIKTSCMNSSYILIHSCCYFFCLRFLFQYLNTTNSFFTVRVIWLPIVVIVQWNSFRCQSQHKIERNVGYLRIFAFLQRHFSVDKCFKRCDTVDSKQRTQQYHLFYVLRIDSFKQNVSKCKHKYNQIISGTKYGTQPPIRCKNLQKWGRFSWT